MGYKSILAHPESSINALSLIQSTSFILSGGGNDNLLKLTHTDGEILHFPKEHSGAINAIDSLEEQVVSGGENDSIVLWDMVTQAKVKKYSTDNISIKNNSVMDCKLFKDLIISCGTNSQLNFHDLKSKSAKPVTSLKDSKDGLSSFDYCAQDYKVVAGSLDGHLYTYDLRKSEVCIDKCSTAAGSVAIIDVVIYDTQILVTYENGTVQLINKRTSEVDRELGTSRSSSHSNSNNTTKSKANPNTTAGPNKKGSKDIYRVNSQLIEDYYAKGKRYIVSGSETGEIHLWNESTGQVEKSFQIPETSQSKAKLLNTVKFLKSANSIVAASGNGYLHIWDNAI